jgi:hypothetical protein
MIKNIENLHDTAINDPRRRTRGCAKFVVQWVCRFHKPQRDHSMKQFVVCPPESLSVSAKDLVLKSEAPDVTWRGIIRRVMVLGVRASRMFTARFGPHTSTLSQCEGFFRSGRDALVGDAATASGGP